MEENLKKRCELRNLTKDIDIFSQNTEIIQSTNITSSTV